jgi:hypothetical protein
MKMRAIVLIVAALAANPVLRAQEPVVGVKDPETLFRDRNPALNKNKRQRWAHARAVYAANDRAGEWLTKYHQHNPNVASGLDGVVSFHPGAEQARKAQADDESGSHGRR